MQIVRLCVLMLTVVLIGVEAPAQLPPDIQADRYLIEAERHIGNRDYAAAKAALDRILALQAEHDLALPEAFWFKHAEVAHQAGDHAEAVESVTRYLTTAGRDGEHYREALELLDRAEAGPPRELRNSIGMEFVLIEAGTFAMGSPETEAGRFDDEGPVHQVTLSQPFYLGKTEATQGQWEAVMGDNPSYFSDRGRTCPVEQVSWEDAQEFISIVLFRRGERAFFVYGFAKSRRANIRRDERKAFQALADELFGLNDAEVVAAMANGTIMEVRYDGEAIQE